jgi:hypothetical protein
MSFGNRLSDNGTFDGYLGILQRGEVRELFKIYKITQKQVDMIIGGFAYTEERAKYFYLVQPLL